jgi:hypothetical protein
VVVKQTLMPETSQADSDGRLRTLAGIITRRESSLPAQTVSCQVALQEHVSDVHGSLCVLTDKGNIALHLMSPN